ncbi:MAG TPA: flavin reductase family protein [Egibacteraceae bacterium]|nr:flavin reductase family protein [Egibacteraceae bacterium]
MTLDDADAAALHALLTALDPPLTVVTVEAGGERSGCLVGFLCQCSIDPPRLLVCLSKRNHTYRVARGADGLAVQLLGEDQLDVAELFGGRTGDEVDKFTATDWRPGDGGTPVLADARGWAAGRILDRFDAGDHEAFLVEVTAAGGRPEGALLHLRHAVDIEPGHDA